MLRSVVFVMCLTASPLWGAVGIEKVLPFTPTSDSVRIVTTLGGQDSGVELTAVLTPAGKKDAVWSGSLGKATGAGNVEKLLEKLPVQSWSPGAPNLYELTVSATRDGKSLASKTVRFGFRQVESKSGNVYLNGRPIFLRGLAINPPGRSVPEPLGSSRQFAYDYVKYLRGQNVNLIRMNESNQDWFDVCDELGMMVYQGFYGSPPSGMSKEEEVKVRALGAVDEAEGKRLPPDFARSMKAYQDEFETFVHHPSIIIYVLSNELPYKGKDAPAVHDFLTRAFEHLAKWDHTRLYIGNAGYGEGREGDLNDVHRYWGWYYNSFLTFLNLRDPKLFGDFGKNQPLTFSECVGNFTGPTGAYNYIEKKQLASALGWTGTAADQIERAQKYQGFTVKQVTESFRRLRSINPRISGLMPFTITFHNWRGITSFEQMKPTAAAEQFKTSYQPVLLSWEAWQTQVYAGTKPKLFAHVVNDAEDFSDLAGATLSFALDPPQTGTSWFVELPRVGYYETLRLPVPVELPPNLGTGEHVLKGSIEKDGKIRSTNQISLFVGGKDWKSPRPEVKKRVALFDPSGKTAAALRALGVNAEKIDTLSNPPADALLVIGEEAFDKPAKLAGFVRAGGRGLILGQSRERLKMDWLPGGATACEHSVNEPEYPVTDRPSYDQAHVNPERPDHPVFAGVDRDRLKYWSDYTDWDQTKPGFPRISPMRFGFKLTRQEDLGRIAVIGDYDSALEGIAIAEFFDGKGSVLLCGLDLIGRVGIDPVADRMLGNLVAYMGSDAKHEVHPTITKPIKWGDFASERGVLVGGAMCGLFRNTRWVPPPTEPDGAPPRDKLSGWNTRPSDQYLPEGIRPRGPYQFTFNGGFRDAKSDIGSGIFWASIPAGRSNVVTRVRNPGTKPATLQVDVNDVKGSAHDVPPGQTILMRTPIPAGATDVGVRYTGDKNLVILESDFQ